MFKIIKIAYIFPLLDMNYKVPNLGLNAVVATSHQLTMM